MKTKDTRMKEAQAMMKVRGGCKPFCFYCDRWMSSDGKWYCATGNIEPTDRVSYCQEAADRWVKEMTE